MKLFLVKSPGGDLLGWGPTDQNYIAKLGAGEFLECETQKVRNPAHHRKFFALLQAAYGAQDKHKNLTSLLVELKIRAGWYDEHITADGKLVYVPKSISWARMDQETFDKFYGEAIVALAQMVPVEEIEMEADNIITRGTV